MATKVSVIVPIYNSENYLYQCLETILGQTLREIEIILIDDGSTDNSYQICKEFEERDNRIRLYKQENSGAGATRNRGIHLATGEYLSFLDADDFFELDMLQILYRKAKATDSDIVFCDYWEFDDVIKQNKNVSWSLHQDLIPETMTFCASDCPDTIFQISDGGAMWSSLYKRSFILENNIKCAESKRCEDVYFSKVASLLANKISCVNKKLVHYRVNVKNALTSCAEKHQYNTFDAYASLYDYLIQKGLFDSYKKTFLDLLTASCIHYEIYNLRYPLRFLSEAYFVNKIIPKYHLDTLSTKHFYNSILADQIKECIQSNNRSYSFLKWYEEKADKIVPIVLATNEKMSLACGVTIQSITCHASNDYFYDVYVLCTDLSDNMKHRLERMGAGNIRITIVPIQHFLSNHPFLLNPELPHITKETYSRFFIPSILAYDKILWLDSDLVVQTDVAKLYNIDLKDNLIAGVADILSDEEEENRSAWRMEPLNHVNAGVLLINNKLWQQEEFQKKFLNEITHPTYPWTLNDQDIINFVCQDKILLLDYRWNFLCGALCWKKNKYESRIRNINPMDYNIIHYNGSLKPWNSSESKLSDFWWEYAQKCRFYQDILRQYIQNTTEKIEKSSQESFKQPKPYLGAESIYQLRKVFFKKGLQYLFSHGRKKKQLAIELIAIMKKLKGE